MLFFPFLCLYWGGWLNLGPPVCWSSTLPVSYIHQYLGFYTLIIIAWGRSWVPTSPLRAGVWSGLVLHGSYECWCKHWELTCIAVRLCPEDVISLYLCSVSHIHSESSLTMVPEPWVSHLMWMSYLELSFPQSPVLCILTNCGSVLIIIYCKYKFLWWGLRDALFYWYNIMLLRTGLIQFPLSGE